MSPLTPRIPVVGPRPQHDEFVSFRLTSSVASNTVTPSLHVLPVSSSSLGDPTTSSSLFANLSGDGVGVGLLATVSRLIGLRREQEENRSLWASGVSILGVPVRYDCMLIGAVGFGVGFFVNQLLVRRNNCTQESTPFSSNPHPRRASLCLPTSAELSDPSPPSAGASASNAKPRHVYVHSPINSPATTTDRTTRCSPLNCPPGTLVGMGTSYGTNSALGLACASDALSSVCGDPPSSRHGRRRRSVYIDARQGVRDGETVGPSSELGQSDNCTGPQGYPSRRRSCVSYLSEPGTSSDAMRPMGRRVSFQHSGFRTESPFALMRALNASQDELNVDKMLSADEVQSYGRQLVLPALGVNGQRALKSSSVLLVGAGGLGSSVALYLAAAGIGRLGILDGDVVCVSNLHRQVIHKLSRAGMSKAESAKRSCLQLNDKIRVESLPIFIEPANAVEVMKHYDIVVDATDNPAARYLINDTAVILNRPVVSGSALRWEGQVAVYNNQFSTIGQGACYRCVFPQPPAGDSGACDYHGVIGVAPGIIGMMQANEVIKLCARKHGAVLSNRMLVFDGLDPEAPWRSFKLRPRQPDCIVCGDKPTITDVATFNYASFCPREKGAPVAAENVISGQVFARTVLSAETPKNKSVRRVLVDVRPRSHFEVYHLSNSVSWPLTSLLTDLKPSGTSTSSETPLSVLSDRLGLHDLMATNDVPLTKLILVVMCRRGIDSAKATESLLEAIPSHRRVVLNAASHQSTQPQFSSVSSAASLKPHTLWTITPQTTASSTLTATRPPDVTEVSHQLIQPSSLCLDIPYSDGPSSTCGAGPIRTQLFSPEPLFKVVHLQGGLLGLKSLPGLEQLPIV